MLFKLASFLGRLGFFKYDGVLFMARGYPMARVRYPEGGTSVPMPIGNAWNYQQIFGGEVVPVSFGFEKVIPPGATKDTAS